MLKNLTLTFLMFVSFLGHSQIQESVLKVLEGGAPMTLVIASKVIELFSKSQKVVVKKDFDLTKREQEILSQLVKGLTYKMIADQCFISYPTVNSHISNIYK